MPGWALILVVLVVALVWLSSAAAASRYGGWSALACDYTATRTTVGERFRSATALMGDDGSAVMYGGSLNVTVGDDGIGLSIGFPQRLFCPPLFIPWRAVASVEARRSALLFDAAIKVHGRDKLIRLRGSAGQCVITTWARVGIPSD